MTLPTKLFVLCSIAACFLVNSNIRIAGFSLLYLLVLGFAGLCVVQWLTRGARAIKPDRVESSLWLFLLLVLVSYGYNKLEPFDEQIAFAASLGQSTAYLFERLSVFGLLALCVLISGFKIIAGWTRDTRRVEFVARTFVLFGLLNALITSVYWLLVTGGTFARYNFLPPLEGSQGIHISLMMASILMAVALLTSHSHTKQYRRYLIFALLVMGFSVLTVMVRQGWATLIFCLVVYFYLRRVKSKKIGLKVRIPKTVLVSLAIVLGIILFKNHETIFNIFAELLNTQGDVRNQSSLSMRFALISRSIEIFLNNPILGVGYGHYPVYSTEKVLVSGKLIYVSSPHNAIAVIGAELGILGLIALTLICWRLFKACRSIFSTIINPVVDNVCNAIFALLIANICSQLISNSLLIPLPTEMSMVQSAFVLWVLFAVICGVERYIKPAVQAARGHHSP